MKNQQGKGLNAPGALQRQRLAGQADGNFPLGGQGVAADGIESFNEGGYVATDVEQEVVDDVGGEDDLPVAGKFLHYEAAGVVVGNVDTGNQPPEEA